MSRTIFEEPDDRFSRFGKSQSEEYIFISLDGAITSEVHIMEAKPNETPKLLQSVATGRIQCLTLERPVPNLDQRKRNKF